MRLCGKRQRTHTQTHARTHTDSADVLENEYDLAQLLTEVTQIPEPEGSECGGQRKAGDHVKGTARLMLRNVFKNSAYS